MLFCAPVEMDVGKNYLVEKADCGGPRVTWADDGVGGKVCLFEKAQGASQCLPREIVKISTLISG